MLASLFARRYLFSPKSRSVINLIATLSVVAVAVPIAAMIILLSVFNGFEGLIRQNYSAFDAHLRITPVKGQTIPVEAIDTAALARIEGVEAYSLLLEQHILLERDGNQATATLRGVDSRYQSVLPLGKAITMGAEEVHLGDLDRLVLGETLAWQLGLRAWTGNEQVNLYTVRRGSFSSLLPMGNYARREVTIGGLFRLDYASETAYALVPLRLAESLLDRKGQCSAVVVRCTSEEAIEATQRRVQQLLGEAFHIENRDEQRASFYRLVQYEKWGVFFITLLVTLVAAFSVIGALSMLIIEKRDERLTLRALGASQHLIRAIFRHEGYLICGLGASIGLLLGIALTLVQELCGVIPMPTANFLTASYPVDFHLVDVAWVLLSFLPIAWGLTTLTVHTMLKHE